MERDYLTLAISTAVTLSLPGGFGIRVKIGLIIDITKGKIFNIDVRGARLFTFPVVTPHFQDIYVGLDFNVHSKIDPGIGGTVVGIRMVLAINGYKSLPCNFRHLLV